MPARGLRFGANPLAWHYFGLTCALPRSAKAQPSPKRGPFGAGQLSPNVEFSRVGARHLARFSAALRMWRFIWIALSAAADQHLSGMESKSGLDSSSRRMIRRFDQ